MWAPMEPAFSMSSSYRECGGVEEEEEEEEQALRRAAIERLPTFARVRRGLLRRGGDSPSSFSEVVYPVSRSYSSVPSAPRIKLVSTSDLKALFSIEDVKLPPWLDGMCMAEYLPTVEDNLKVQVVEAVASIGQRRRFIEALAPLFGRPLEADPVFCRKATILAISGVFTFLIHFSIPIQFPKQQPILTLQSSQHFNSQGTPILSPPINDYPWSPRWDTPQMVERIFDFLVDECLNFKKYCNDAIPQQQ